MPGIRIYHPTARSGQFTFEHVKRPYRRWNRVTKKREATPLWCPVCVKFHSAKTYHVDVDAGGHAIVSREVWDFMRKYGAAGFELANEVTTPPPLIIGVGGQPISTPTPLED